MPRHLLVCNASFSCVQEGACRRYPTAVKKGSIPAREWPCSWRVSSKSGGTLSAILTHANTRTEPEAVQTPKVSRKRCERP